MSCPRCQVPVPEGSRFCNACGAPIGPADPSALPPRSETTEVEQELWRGRFSGKGLAHWWMLWIVEVVALLYLWFGVFPTDTRGHPVVRWGFAALMALPVVAISWTCLVRKLSIRYRLTTHRLFREEGILARRINEVELLRVDDVSVRQNILQRIFNVGVITVIAPTDQTEPHLELVGIENPIEVKEQIRHQIRERRSRSLHMESI